MIVKDGLYYTKTHEWLKLDGDVATIGISDFAQNQMSDIVYVDFPKVGTSIKAGEIVGTVESVKSAEGNGGIPKCPAREGTVCKGISRKSSERTGR